MKDRPVYGMSSEKFWRERNTTSVWACLSSRWIVTRILREIKWLTGLGA